MTRQMTHQKIASADRLTDALRRQAGRVNRTGAYAWRFELRNGKPLAVRATRAGEWLRLTTPAGLAPSSDLPGQLLALNGLLPPGAKFTFERRHRFPTLCVDVCLAGEHSIEQRLTAACNTLLESGACLSGLGEVPPHRSDNDDERLDELMVVRCRDLLSDAQWAWTERTGQHMRVDLQLRRTGAPMVITQFGEAPRLEVELVDVTRASDSSRFALGVFLLAATGSLRLVRAVAASKGQRQAVVLEVLLGAQFTASDFDNALSCLASACELFGPEAAALRNGRLADEYLTARGWDHLHKQPALQVLLDEPEPILEEA